MRVAFIGHSYHGKTLSSRFFVSLLERLGKVDVFLDESWAGATPSWLRNFVKDSYDLIVVWQAHEVLAHLGHHPNIVFAPMYDAMFWHDEFFWKSSFSKYKVLCFSRHLQYEMMRRGVTQAYFQYFPNPDDYDPVSDFDDLRGFFWYRRKNISPSFVFELSRQTEFARFHIHNAPDPDHEVEEDWVCPHNVEKLVVSTWFDSPHAYREAMQRHNVFFAPRAHEGIGMGFLEAMAAGMCVVAPDTPTMNEYISAGTNGLLYSLDNPCPLDFSGALSMGARAKDSMERGYKRWQEDIPRLFEFLTTPRRTLLAGRPNRAEEPWQQSLSAVQREEKFSGEKPRVTVVTVCLNAEADLEKTILSVLSQDMQDFEYVVLDGGSEDGTLDLIGKYDSHIAYWRSEHDGGVYHAMNGAVDVARGNWVLFMNAGDTFADQTALTRMFAQVPETADVVYGHHLYRKSGVDIFSRAADFETTWSQLRSGRFSKNWLGRIPGHQATAVRRELLGSLRFDTNYKIAADHDLLFRARQHGAEFFNCDELISVYVGGGFSERQYEQCKQEWRRIAVTYGDVKAAHAFYDSFEAAAPPPRSLAVVLRLLAYNTVVAAARVSPSFGRLVRSAMSHPAFLAFGRTVIRLLGSLDEASPPHDDGKIEEPRVIDFRDTGWPPCVMQAVGFSEPDRWGRQFSSSCGVIRFNEPLPRNFDLVVAAHAIGRSVQKALSVEVGDFRAITPVNSTADKFYLVHVEGTREADEIRFTVMDATSGSSAGVGLVSLEIFEHTRADDQHAESFQ